jgi:hypothetical protein
MKIYILIDTEEIVTEDAVLAAMLTEIYSVNSSEDKNHLVQAYDAKVIELFGEGARHLGSEQ